MQSLYEFDLFLFDFDGLLVNTEHLHYQAYLNMLTKRGHQTNLSFASFFELAHMSSSAWKEALYADVPGLEPNWQVLHEEKTKSYLELVATSKMELMPGAEALLKELKRLGKRRCVVTHSFLSQVQLIRAKLPALETLPHWITREDYEKPKPNPECYLRAIELYGKKEDRIIGFEDSLRGLRALMGTPAMAVLVCPNHHPLLEIALAEGGKHFESLKSVFDLM
jgi:HAD superfamily hydrolase (TIGR01509 family)